jgi:anthranilate phosphoribosyltransferase
MIKESINSLVQGIDLSDFLTALRVKGETVDEITAAARIMREKASHIKAPEGTLDTCGTGGDMSHTFNISTTVALVVSACEVPVAKHGNRSVSSRSGSADVLEALGINIQLEPAGVEKCLAETGFGFLFAPLFHPAMKYAIGPRREMGIRTIFNVLGPITNPAGARRQIVGVFTDRFTEPLAQVLGNLGSEDVMVVHGEDGLDEITITNGTRVSRFRDGKLETLIYSPEDFGFSRHPREAILGGERDDNAKITTDILNGEKGPKREIVLMNSAAALVVAGKTEDLKEAVALAAEAIDSKKAIQKLEEVKKVSHKL